MVFFNFCVNLCLYIVISVKRPNVDFCAWPGYVSAMFVMLYTGGPSNKPSISNSGEAEALLTEHGKLVNMYGLEVVTVGELSS